MKKILIVTAAFYPQQSPRAFRATELAKEFASQGHSVTVLTTETAENKAFAEEKGFEISALGKNPFKQFQFSKSNKLLYLFERLVFRFLNLLLEHPDIGYYFLVKSKLKYFKGYDLLISIATPFPIHWGVAAVWKKHSNYNPAKTWVADCGDPYMHAPNDTFPKAFYFHYFENMFMSKADYISIPFEDLKYQFNSKFRTKFVTIPQGFNFEDVETLPYKENNILTLMYAGTVIPGHRHPVELINYLNKKNIEYRFIFYGTQKSTFTKECQVDYRLVFKGKIDREELIKELSTADFLVNVMQKSSTGKIKAIPSKLIDYRLAGRPILNYEYGSLNFKVVDNFLNYDYRESFDDPNFERYNIKNVTAQFLEVIL